jgi:gliding motility-associated-like protein
LNEDISGLLPGQYIVTITDNHGCTHKDTANLTQPLAPLAISLTKDDADCFGAADGSIDATVTGGTTPYSYSWSNGESTEDIQNLIAGTYIVQVTDFNGCQVSADTIISQPPPIIATSTQVNVLCYGAATGSIDLSLTGGITPYQYSWSNGATSEDVSNLLAGIYSVTVTDANNCSINYSVTITQPLQPLTLSITKTDALCVGGLQGTTNLTISGGTAPYTQIWNNNQTAEDLANLVAGYYYATVTDNNGCSDTIGATILDPDNTMVPTISHTDVSCFGGSDGTVDLNVTGGLLPYSYAWNTGAGSEDLNSLPTGNYFVTITDGNSCQSFISAFVDQPQAPLSATQQITNVLCFNDATGAIDVTTSGGTQPYSFSWNSGQPTEDLTSVQAGNYQLTITDAKNCLLVINPQITQPSDIQLSAITQDINCYGDATGWIDLSIVGGVAPYTLLWNNNQTVEDLVNLPAGTYQVHVTDNNQCQDSLTITLTQPAAPLQVTAITQNISCFGGNDGSIDITISGGTTPYSFNWSNAVVVQDQQDLYAGIYQINITDNKGCTTIGNYNLTQPAQPLTTQMTMTEPLCNGDSNATATVTAIGGTPAYTYLWESGETTPTITGIPIGTYIVEVTDAKGCTTQDTIVVTQPNPLIVNADSTWVSCWGLADGGVQSTVQGGVGPYAYNWSPINIATPTVNNLPAGIYTVTVTDFFNCQAQATTQILQPDSLYATFITTNILCNGFSTGAIDASIFGGTTPYSYYCPTLLPSADLSNLTAGTYNYSVIDDNGCSKQYSLILTQPSAVSTTAQMTPVNCFSGSDGALNITTTGGVGPYTYVWSDGDTTEDVDSLAAGSYSVQVTDANNCVSTFNFAVTQPQQALTLSLTQVNVSCFGDSTGSINLSVSGGTPGYSYAWNNGPLTQDVFVLDTGFYQVIVTDANDCVDSISTIITQPAAPISIAETHVNILCFGASTGSIDITPSGGTPSVLTGYTYEWSTNETTQDVQTLPWGPYQVVVTDSLLCTDTLEVTLTQPLAPLDVTFDIENVKCYGDSTGSLLANITGGTAPYEFGWSTLDSTLFIDSLPIGSYSISIIDSHNCTYTEAAVVSQPVAPLSATYTEVQPQCFGYSDGQLILTTTGGTPGYQYDWTTGDSTAVVDSLATGTYSVMVTDTNGCVFNLDCFLGEPAQLQPSFDADVLVGCSPLLVNFTNTSDADFNCAWTFGTEGSFEGCEDVSYTFEEGGVYDVSLTVYDANGCFNDVTYADMITVYQTPSASMSADPTVLFPFSNTTTVLNTSTGGDFYVWNMGVGGPDELYFEPGAFTYPINVSDTFMITLYASTVEGCADTAYQQILFNNDPFYYAPNTFIPDGDGRNDVWNVVFSNPEYLKKYEVRIFNRWGELIFDTQDPNTGWDGTYKGLPCQDGTYTWSLVFTWYDYRTYDFHGHVNLLR